ncbi:hypothetical protein [Streptomyces sp. NRRL S-350]|uniref:hypothetical protein n=1 Tax=Streptomyces sp. NRRL S-350 TaxID=1463902 RepID=UPI0004BFE104|nr:hypothetical protein [Streptomyces sp. NRRL S-350]
MSSADNRSTPDQQLAEALRLLAHGTYVFSRAANETDLLLIHEACNGPTAYIAPDEQLDPLLRAVLDHSQQCPAQPNPTAGEPRYLQLEQTEVVYDTPSGPATRPIRAFRTGPRHVTCFVTEHGTGMSITNAAREVAAALRTLWHPDTAIRVIEHYPADSISPAHYDEVFSPPSGAVAWRRLSVAALTVEFEGRLPR